MSLSLAALRRHVVAAQGYTTRYRTAGPDDVAAAIRRLSAVQFDSISQLPVVRAHPAESLSDVVGSLRERGLLDRVFKNPDALNDEVSQAMQPPLAAVDAADSLDRVFSDLSGGSPAVVVARGGRPAGMLTRSDLLEYLARARNGS